MSIPDYSGNPSYRLSTAERERAVSELRQHVAEGRLTESEFTERSKAARTAVTRGQLAPLFEDLPATTFPASTAAAVADARPVAVQDAVPAYGAPEAPSAEALPTASAVAPSQAAPAATVGWKDPQAKEVSRAGATVMAIVPFVSLTLFFVTGSVMSWSYSWLWFLLVPVAGIVIYGPNGKPKRPPRR
ncbi:DUF1707 domain-containing protein [Agreia sp. COWG]|uniref:DUF1707 SHOCT-like domain-containing protein n=1 Tax=Agreia sp. COWG TaxID=2773266 RepID=UPI001926146E|nr:DUF1707 domain-containing protein [Agreia sp. COWG]CAD5992320.1 conserved protein of unknown function [Agreia sp. COWG]